MIFTRNRTPKPTKKQKAFADTKALWESDRSGFSALAFAAHIVLANSDLNGGSSSSGEIELSRVFSSASKASICMDCFHDECGVVGDLMMASYRMIERAERIEKQKMSPVGSTR